jgi:hypothetical protein
MGLCETDRVRPAAANAEGHVELSIGDEAVSLRQDELDRLVEALGSLEQREAADVAEEITALRLAGGAIRLFPTEAEQEALRQALARETEQEPLGAALLRLVGLCDPASDDRD